MLRFFLSSFQLNIILECRQYESYSLSTYFRHMFKQSSRLYHFSFRREKKNKTRMREEKFHMRKKCLLFKREYQKNIYFKFTSTSMKKKSEKLFFWESIFFYEQEIKWICEKIEIGIKAVRLFQYKDKNSFYF